GEPWDAYRQFCQHFLAPLLLMSRCDVRLNQLLKVYIDGIPLDLASKLLPRSTLLNFGIAMHLHAHAKSQKAYADTNRSISKQTSKFTTLSKNGLIGLLTSLENTVRKIKGRTDETEWGDYYNDTNYTPAG